MPKIKQATPVPTAPHLAGLIYNHKRDMVGVHVNGVVFYPDGTTELGIDKVFIFGDAVEFLQRVTLGSQRHSAGRGALINLREYAKLTKLDKARLAAFGESQLGYLCGVRRIRVGRTEELYFPQSLKPETIKEQVWLDSDKELQELIIEYLRINGPATQYVITTALEREATDVYAQLGRLTFRGVTELYGGKFRLTIYFQKHGGR